MADRKKRVMLMTDFALAKTGFGRNAKAVLTHLYKTGKYDLTHYCCGLQYSNPQHKRVPWKSVGSLPDNPQELEQLNRDPNLARMASYGSHYLDKVVQESKPDVYIAVQDIWGVDFAIEKKWFNKTNSVIWTTLDSLPILPSAVNCAPKVKNYWVWSNFAEKGLHKLGHKHVRTMHGAVDESHFCKLPTQKRKELRSKFNISQDSFVIGFVFRNQLRKSVPNLLEGYSIWKNQNPNIKNTRLLLHTHFSEGWNILKLAEEYKINKDEILTTYTCRACGEFEIKPFFGEEQNCRFCKAEKAQVTTNVSVGVSEDQLNEVYNLMDVYAHPFTSGGQEIPIQEAKLTELITLVTNYSCGEEMCEEAACSFPLDWSEYREHGTEFRKASTLPSSIAKQINRVYNMSEIKRAEMGRKARQWTLDNFSVQSVGRQIEEFIDSCGFAETDFVDKEEEKDPFYQIPDIQGDSEWLKNMYHNILKVKDTKDDDEGLKYWLTEIAKGTSRKDIENYFRNVALKENQKNKKIDFSELLSKDDEGRRILFVIPESIGDVYMCTSLFESIKETYPDYNLYIGTKPEYFEILEGNPFVHKTIQYTPQMDNLLWLEGVGDHKGYFEIAFLPYIGTQRNLDYLHNNKDKIALDLNK